MDYVAERVKKINALHKEVWQEKHESRLREQCVEELAELQLAILHEARNKTTKDHIINELIDTLICIMFLIDDFELSGMNVNNIDLDGRAHFVLSKLEAKLEAMKNARGERGDDGVTKTGVGGKQESNS